MYVKPKKRSNPSRKSKARGVPLTYKCVLVVAGIIISGATKYFVDVRQKTLMRDTGYHIEQYRQQVLEAENIRATLYSNLEEVRRPEEVTRRLRGFGIVLVRPPLERVVHLPLPEQIDGLSPDHTTRSERPDARLSARAGQPVARVP